MGCRRLKGAPSNGRLPWTGLAAFMRWGGDEKFHGCPGAVEPVRGSTGADLAARIPAEGVSSPPGPRDPRRAWPFSRRAGGVVLPAGRDCRVSRRVAASALAIDTTHAARGRGDRHAAGLHDARGPEETALKPNPVHGAHVRLPLPARRSDQDHLMGGSHAWSISRLPSATSSRSSRKHRCRSNLL